MRRLTSHVLGSFREGVLKTCNTGKDFGESNKDVRRSLNPHAERWRSFAGAGLITTRALRVDEVLDQSSNSHGDYIASKTGCDLLDRGELEPGLGYRWIDILVENRDEDQ